MAIINRPSKKGMRYQVKVRDRTGKLFPHKTFHRKTDAERHQRELLYKLDKGEIALNKEIRCTTVLGYWKRWSSERRFRTSEGWKISQDQQWRDFIEPSLGPMLLLEVRPQDIGRIINDMSQKNYSGQTVLHVYHLLHRIFDDAVHYYELLHYNPVLKRDRPQVIPVERRRFSPEESYRLLRKSKDHFLGPAIWLGLLCGLRSETIIALKFGDIDLNALRLTIKAGYKKKLRRIEPYPKGKKIEHVPLPEDLANYLFQLSQGKTPEDFVSPGENGQMLRYETFNRKLKVLCQEAGVQILTPHELRHSCTVLFTDQGAGEQDIRKLLCQRSLSAVKRYIHATDSRLQGVAARVKVPPLIDGNVVRLDFGT